jgi:hypothetical protein
MNSQRKSFGAMVNPVNNQQRGNSVLQGRNNDSGHKSTFGMMVSSGQRQPTTQNFGKSVQNNQSERSEQGKMFGAMINPQSSDGGFKNVNKSNESIGNGKMFGAAVNSQSRPQFGNITSNNSNNINFNRSQSSGTSARPQFKQSTKQSFGALMNNPQNLSKTGFSQNQQFSQSSQSFSQSNRSFGALTNPQNSQKFPINGNQFSWGKSQSQVPNNSQLEKQNEDLASVINSSSLFMSRLPEQESIDLNLLSVSPIKNQNEISVHNYKKDISTELPNSDEIVLPESSPPKVDLFSGDFLPCYIPIKPPY